MTEDLIDGDKASDRLEEETGGRKGDRVSNYYFLLVTKNRSSLLVMASGPCFLVNKGMR